LAYYNPFILCIRMGSGAVAISGMVWRKFCNIFYLQKYFNYFSD